MSTAEAHPTGTSKWRFLLVIYNESVSRRLPLFAVENPHTCSYPWKSQSFGLKKKMVDHLRLQSWGKSFTTPDPIFATTRSEKLDLTGYPGFGTAVSGNQLHGLLENYPWMSRMFQYKYI
jgi:hypothetical protein